MAFGFGFQVSTQPLNNNICFGKFEENTDPTRERNKIVVVEVEQREREREREGRRAGEIGGMR